MGVLSLFNSLNRVGALSAQPHPTDVAGLPWQSPSDTLTRIVVDDIFGDIPELVDRAAAITVPPIARGRALLVGSISDLPLVAYRGEERVAKQPGWLYRTNGVSPWHRMAWTVDDLIFYGASLWMRENGDDGFPISTWRVPAELWQVNDRGQIEVRTSLESNWRTVPANTVIYIPGPSEGLLVTARNAIRGARSIESAWVARTQAPIPPTLFEQVEQGTVNATEVQDLLDAWGAARRNPKTAGTAFVPYGLKAVFPPVGDDSQMFIEGRNAIRLDIANHLNIPASLLDGSTATASLTYTTTEGQRSSFHEQSLRYWTAPIEHRLSMDDVVPRGQRVRLDITYTTQVAPTGEPGED